jgi:hypothetical protein
VMSRDGEGASTSVEVVEVGWEVAQGTEEVVLGGGKAL